MAPTNGKTAVSPAPVPAKNSDATVETTASSAAPMDEQTVDATFAALKTLLSTVEKLQKARENVGDIKPLLIRLLDGEMLSGEELDQLKSGVNGLGKLVKLYGDYQEALEQAQPARSLLDVMVKS